MKALMAVGILLVLLGGGLMVMGSIEYEDKHEAEILGIEVSATETEEKRIPLAVSGTILGLGAVRTVVGAVKMKGAR